MRDVYDIIKQISNTSGRHDKEQLLLQHKDNKLLKDILQFTFNPYIVTGLSKKKIDKKIRDLNTVRLKTIQDAMDYLKNNNTGKDIDISNIRWFILSEPIDLHELYKQIFTKSLVIGATAKTLNKIYGEGFIPEFNVMLAEKYFEHEHKIKGEFIISKKLDGNRNILVNDGNIAMFTRQGQSNEGFIDIEVEALLLPKEYAYDGEFIAVNDKDLGSADLYRETTSKVRKDGVKTNVIFYIFDMIPLQDFKKGISYVPCKERKELLHETLSNLNLKWIKEVPSLYIGTDKNEIIRLLNEMIAQGEEGCMVNIADAPYECRRTQGILKVKKMQTCDLEVIGFEEGDGRLKGTLGRMNVSYKNNIVGVGSGFTDVDRSYIWNNQNELLGKIAEIQYFEQSQNAKTGEVSLRFPVFLRWRDDKTEESYY